VGTSITWISSYGPHMSKCPTAWCKIAPWSPVLSGTKHNGDAIIKPGKLRHCQLFFWRRIVPDTTVLCARHSPPCPPFNCLLLFTTDRQSGK
jgi:hypothetical protein